MLASAAQGTCYSNQVVDESGSCRGATRRRFLVLLLLSELGASKTKRLAASYWSMYVQHDDEDHEDEVDLEAKAKKRGAMVSLEESVASEKETE